MTPALLIWRDAWERLADARAALVRPGDLQALDLRESLPEVPEWADRDTWTREPADLAAGEAAEAERIDDEHTEAA